MAFRFLLLLSLVSILGCDAPTDQRVPPPVSRWADDRLWAVLDAQDHRDAPALLAALTDTSAAVREAAALALASVQDSASLARLVPVLADADPRVRRAAAFALSFSRDTVLLAQLDARMQAEPDSTVRAAMARDAFRAAVASGPLDALFLLSYLEHGDRAIRARAAAMLGRRPKEQLVPLESSVVHAVSVEKDPEVRALLVLALKHTSDTSTIALLKRYAASDPSALLRVNAVRALTNDPDAAFLLDRTNDTVAAVRQTAIEQLQQLHPPDTKAVWEHAQRQPDPATATALCGLVMREGDGPIRAACLAELDSLGRQGPGPYLSAERIKARFTRQADIDTLRAIVLSDAPTVVRQAAFAQWYVCFEDKLRSAGIDQRAVDRAHALFLKDVLLSGDAGLIAAACERAEGGSRDLLGMVFNDPVLSTVRAALHPIRDLETLQLLDHVRAERDGKPDPPHTGPPFDHSIDRARLLSLKNGQPYRIVTSKGDIVLALEPEAAPGSCAAFDSLVAAHYYDGKYFHRVVPDFVAQGGCPRGDGYGGMPWTLRTEIGYDGFTTGAVGLASAGRDTESCQFFITLMDAPHLDGRYTRFAHVVSGMDVAQRLQVGDAIERVERLER